MRSLGQTQSTALAQAQQGTLQHAGPTPSQTAWHFGESCPAVPPLPMQCWQFVGDVGQAVCEKSAQSICS